MTKRKKNLVRSAKELVMKPLFKMRVERDKTKFKRKIKHTKRYEDE